MVTLNKIYTKTGDEGLTSLGDGSRISKNNIRVEAYGTIDEANSIIGVVRSYTKTSELIILDNFLSSIQNELFDLGAELSTPKEDANRQLNLKTNDVEIENSEKKIKKYVPLSKRQDKPDSALWLTKQHSILKDSQIAKLVGITSNSVKAIRNKSYWNFNNLNAKDPVAMGLFSQKDLINAIEKAERRIKREKKDKEKEKLSG